jgi:hypothetical protein
LTHQKLNGTSDFLSIAKDIGLPDSCNAPASARKLPSYLPVSFSVSGDFCNPILRVVPSKQVAPQARPTSTMPEIAIAKDGHLGFAKGNIRITRQIGDILSVPKAEPSQLPTKQDFVKRILLAICSLGT